MDNFSKFIARQVPTTDKGIFSSCLWTGVAVIECDPDDDHKYDMQIKHKPDGAVLPAMPDKLLQHSDRIVNGVTLILGNCRNYYDKSLVKKYDVRCIPLKVNTKIFTDMADIVEHKRNTTGIVYPAKLIEHNIGSNHGLVTLLRQLMVELGMDNDTCTNYEVLNVDENIYWRTMKVSYIYMGCFVLFL
jgi:hypothetical protein